MSFTLFTALILLIGGILRLVLVRLGKLPEGVGYQKYVPYAFIAISALLFVIAWFD